jgi:hypothetical protein
LAAERAINAHSAELELANPRRENKRPPKGGL